MTDPFNIDVDEALKEAIEKRKQNGPSQASGDSPTYAEAQRSNKFNDHPTGANQRFPNCPFCEKSLDNPIPKHLPECDAV